MSKAGMVAQNKRKLDKTLLAHFWEELRESFYLSRFACSFLAVSKIYHRLVFVLQSNRHQVSSNFSVNFYLWNKIFPSEIAWMYSCLSAYYILNSTIQRPTQILQKYFIRGGFAMFMSFIKGLFSLYSHCFCPRL